MKVLHVSSEACWRGGEQQIIYLVESLRQLGVDAQIVCKTRSAVADYCFKNELAHFPVPFSSAYDLKTARILQKLCWKEKFDLLHLHTSKGHTLGVLAGIIGLKIPMVLHRRVDFPVKRNPFSHWKYNYKQIRKIICVSDFVKKTLEPSIRMPQKLCTIYSGVELNQRLRPKEELIEQFGLPPDALLIGNTAALADHKDYPTFVRTAAILARELPNAHFVIIGDGPLKQPIERLIRKKGLTDRFTMTGFIPEAKSYLSALDLFLHTSKTEGLGTSLLDAYIAGVPVVATAAGGIPEIIQNEDTGLLASVGDAEELADSVLRMLQNPALKSRLTEAASLKVREFEQGQMAKKVLNVYRQVLGGIGH